VFPVAGDAILFKVTLTCAAGGLCNLNTVIKGNDGEGDSNDHYNVMDRSSMYYVYI
jgi:hypothetical protein